MRENKGKRIGRRHGLKRYGKPRSESRVRESKPVAKESK